MFGRPPLLKEQKKTRTTTRLIKELLLRGRGSGLSNLQQGKVKGKEG